VALAVEIDELPDPGAVAVFSAGTEVPAAADDGYLVEQARGGWLTPLGSLLVVEGKNQEHNPEALRLLFHKAIKRQPDQHSYKKQDDRPRKCLSLY
jgi:hypothetical protein